MSPEELADVFEDIAVEERLCRERGELARADALLGALERVRKEVEQEALRPTAGLLPN